ncbi:MAG: sugar phosphate isomerase/epimerase [Phycisphaeraceae bacterium]|nr:sugar phosphate isomerase/epimerase [Phycisphaerae bacterium]MBX3392281.1 sugar phosphate isomerase/epimerase [Phycisphaeraceae bacterium]HRJ49774.1 sugar phosphate isomerase/epimerase family protein [Phycisphaerales bacterium]
MTRAAAPTIGVCSWSLQPAGPAELVERVLACDLSAVQLALDPVRTGRWDEIATIDSLGSSGIRVLSGMMAMEGEDYSTLGSIKTTGGVAPDQTWTTNLAAAHENAELAGRMGIGLVTFHAGFLPHDRKDPRRGVLIDRLRELAVVFADRGVAIACETGQESAGTLLGILTDLNSSLADRTPKTTVGVNFDPANMILYGMGDPVASLLALAPVVRQIHVKDAIPTTMAGTWGKEVPVGTGAVDWPAFFGAFATSGLNTGNGVNLVIEREAGDDRVRDVIRARTVIQSHAR